jgi:catalase
MAASDALSIHKKMRNTLEGRHVGILIADGSDAAALGKLKKAITAAGGTPVIVAPKVGGTTLSDGTLMKADGQLAGMPSQIFDAVALLLSADATKLLVKDGAAVEFVMNAFGHLKAIGFTPESQPLLDKAGVDADAGIVPITELPDAAGKRFYAREPGVRTLA